MAGEVIVERRRRWTPEQKAALIAEVEAEGGHVSMVARRHGISASLLYNWRSACKAALAVRAMAARYGLTRAGLPPAGTRQLRLTHHKCLILLDSCQIHATRCLHSPHPRKTTLPSPILRQSA